MILKDRIQFFEGCFMGNRYYNLKNILSKNADYNLIIGERSNGKTYACLKWCLEQYVNSGYIKQFAYIRRWHDDIIGKRAEVVFNAIINNNEVYKLTKGKFSNIKYYNGKYFLANYDDNQKKFVADTKPFCFNFALSDMEHDKSTSYPDIDNIIFDEFITRKYYLTDEFVIFMNVLSTIIRDRKINKIFMCGNTVNKYNPYFEEFGIKNDVKQGCIDVYKFGNSDLTLAIEYCEESKGIKNKSNSYFAFNNAKLNMIKGGKWELDFYPHLRENQRINFEKDCLFSFYVMFDNQILQGDIIQNEDLFLFFHKKTTPIKEKNALIYSLNIDSNFYHRKNILRNVDKLDKKIAYFFAAEKVFYQSNDIGETIHNYLMNCVKH